MTDKHDGGEDDDDDDDEDDQLQDERRVNTRNQLGHVAFQLQTLKIDWRLNSFGNFHSAKLFIGFVS